MTSTQPLLMVQLDHHSVLKNPASAMPLILLPLAKMGSVLLFLFTLQSALMDISLFKLTNTPHDLS